MRGVCCFNSAGGMNTNRWEKIPWILRPLLWLFLNVLLDPNGNGPTYFENFKSEANVRSVFKAVYPRHPERADDALIDSILWPAEDPNAAKVFLKIFRGPAGPSPEAALTRIKVPVLGLWGEKDPWTPVDGGFHPGSRFGEHCESWELVTLPGIGHCPHDEAPELCNAEMLKWLKRLDGE